MPSKARDGAQGRLQHGGSGGGERGQDLPFEIGHLGILSVIYLQQMLLKLPFPSIWEFHYFKSSSGPNHAGPVH